MLGVFIAGSIEAGLEAKLLKASPSDTFKVFLVLKEQPDYEGYRRRYKRRDHATLKAIFGEVRELARVTQEPLLNLLESRGIRYKSYYLTNEVYVVAEAKDVLALSQHPSVAYVYEEEIVYLKARPGDSPYKPLATAWGVGKIKADSVWIQLGIDGTGVLLGHMDSGVMANHPALSGKVVHWYDAYGGSPTPVDQSNCYYHGTHTAGTMVGGDGTGPFTEDIGVAPGATLASVRIFGGSNCSSSTSIIKDAFQKFVEWKVDSGYNIVAVNNSWGSSFGYSDTYWNDVQAWITANIVPVFAIGNSCSWSGASSPGNYPHTIGVGATNSSDDVASFSCRGPAPSTSPWNNTSYWLRSDWNYVKPNIGAPGVSIRSAYGSSGYINSDGTSMAAPHVTGVVGLMFAKNPALSVEQVYDILLNTADTPPGTDCGTNVPNNNCGWGRVNALEAVNAVPASTQPYILINSISFSDGNDGIAEAGESGDLIITLRNSGGVDANGTVAILNTASPYVTITDNSSNYGTIASLSSSDNSSDPFSIQISPSAPVGLSVDFEMYISANSGAYTDTLEFSLMIGQAVSEIVIDTGTASLSIFPFTGGLGFENSNQNRGSGFVYPEGGDNLLYYGGIAFATSQNHVLDSWYDGGDLPHYYGGFFRTPPLYGDQNGAFAFYDAATGVRIEVEAYGEDQNLPNWIYLLFRLINTSSSPVSNAYVGVFADYDVNTYSSNYTDEDTTLNLIYVYHPTYPYRGGIAIVSGPVANLSAIHNQTYVYGGTPDSIKWKFLTGDLSQDGTSASDWSVVASSGPFNIAPGDTQVVVFALVGLENASVSAEKPSSDRLRVKYGVENGELSLEIRGEGEVSISVYHIDGRRIRLYEGRTEGKKVLRKRLPRGVYVLEVVSDRRETFKLIVR